MTANHWFGLLAACLCGFSVLRAQPASFEFRGEKEQFAAAAEKRKASLAECDGSKCIFLSGSSKWAVRLDPAEFAGRTFFIDCEYRTEGISVKPEKKNTHGFKAQLYVVTGEKKKLYFHGLPVSGTHDWNTDRRKIVIPAGCTEIILSVSIPDGKAWVRKLTLASKEAVRTPAETKSNNVQTLNGVKKK